MELWDRFRTLFRIMRRSGLPALVPPRLASDSTAGTGDPDGTGQVLVQRYELNGRLQTALLERAGREARPAQELQEPLSAAELERAESRGQVEETVGSSSGPPKGSNRAHLPGIYQPADGGEIENLGKYSSRIREAGIDPVPVAQQG